MTKIIASIFGKSSGITKEDIEKTLLKKVHESAQFECKQLRNLDDCRQIIRGLVGFLNSFDGSGLLVLGVKTKGGICEEITPIKTDDSYSTERLRSVIIGNIKSILTMVHFPQLSIVKVQIDAENNCVWFIEIERKEDNAYYSSITQQMSIRRNDETYDLPLVEALSFISSKVSARVFAQVEVNPLAYDNQIEFRVDYMNKGLSPGRELTSIIKISNPLNLNVKLEGPGIQDVSELNPGMTKTYQVTAGCPPNSTLIYPGNQKMTIGKLIVRPNQDFVISLIFNNFESQGKSFQHFKISNINKQASVEEVKSEYAPYLSITG